MDVPEVRYARKGGVAIAYQVVGEGPTDLVYSPVLVDLYSLWLHPHSRRFLDRLTDAVRLTVFNPRGTGLSDRPRNVTLEARMDDVSAVLDAVGTERATLMGVSTSANVCALFAATYPERCERFVLFRPFPRAVRSDTSPTERRKRNGSRSCASCANAGAIASTSRTWRVGSIPLSRRARMGSSGSFGVTGSPPAPDPRQTGRA